MEKAKITPYQLFVLIMYFEMGALLWNSGGKAKQANWIAMLIGMMGGLVLWGLYSYLYRKYPDLPLTEYIKKILGKYIGTIIGIMYICFFLYAAARDMRDGTELLLLSFPHTPISAAGLLLMIAIIYAIYCGIEVLGRSAEVFFILFIFLIVFGTLAVYGTPGIIRLENLLPVLEPGWKTIIQTAINETWMWPFGETICFTMILPYLNNPKLGFKIGISGMLLSGFMLAFIHALEIAVLGVEGVDRSVFPLMKMAQEINIGDFIQRLDAFVLVSLILYDFFKVAVFAYAAVIGVSCLFNVSKNYFFLPAGIIVFVTSIKFADSVAEHQIQGAFVLKNIYPVFAAYIPLVLFIVTLLRQKFGKSQ